MTELGFYASKIIDSETPEGISRIKQIREQNKGKIIGFASGCYDVIQPGHVIFFEQIMQLADIAVIGLGRDSVLSALKKGRPINPEINRAYVLAAMTSVDYVILDSHHIDEGKIDFTQTIGALSPDILVLNDDDSAVGPKQKLCDKLGIRMEMVHRSVPDFLQATSTTDIIAKIKNS